MIAEQFLNAKFIVDVLGAALGVRGSNEVFVSRQTISEGVKELMAGQKGRRARERAEAIGRVARRAVQNGGSSHDALSKLIDQLRAC